MLLAQALTHPSAVGALTPCYQRLAAVGEAVVEFYVTRRLVGGAPLSGGKCAATALPLDGCSAQPVPLSDSRLPSRHVDSGARGSAEKASSDDNEETEGRWRDSAAEAARRKDAYCNYVMFARTAGALGFAYAPVA